MSCGNGDCGCGCGDLVTLKSPKEKKGEEGKKTRGNKKDLGQNQSKELDKFSDG